MNSLQLDIIIIGSGHAGCEAALACARLGLKTWIYTLNADTIGFMPCNPSIGGLGKGHIVKEIDALGGEMAKAADKSCIQYKLLGTGKGPAVQGSRMQCDRVLYSLAMKAAVENEPNILIRQEMVNRLIIHDGQCVGITERSGYSVSARAVILAAGTFLAGMIHVGSVSYGAGRAGEFPSLELAVQLRDIGFPWGRFKTGTPPRLKGSTVDFASMIEDPGDATVRPFSMLTEKIDNPRKSCFRTHTSRATKKLVAENLCKSPLYSGTIKGTPARYCPSLEDKIARFPERERHPVVVEPEGLYTTEVYVKGLGNSLPPELQIELVRSVPGLEHAEIVRPAYAIEYDYINPTCLHNTLETKLVANLYFAGQINGTSGYEEAAGQGLWAGINAAHKILGKQPFVLDRTEAYIAVMIDDLVTRGVNEPYRMFTSRAEYRLLLREDNATERLLKIGHDLELVSSNSMEKYEEKMRELDSWLQHLEAARVRPEARVNELIAQKGAGKLVDTVSGIKFLKRPEIQIADLIELGILPESIDSEISEKIAVRIKYDGYIQRQQREALQFSKLERVRLPLNFNYDAVPGLSRELREKLKALKPSSIGQISRISGVTPAAVSAIMVSLKSGKETLPS